MPPRTRKEYTCKSCGISGYDASDYSSCTNCNAYYCMNHINSSARTCASCNTRGCGECTKKSKCNNFHHPKCACACQLEVEVIRKIIVMPEEKLDFIIPALCGDGTLFPHKPSRLRDESFKRKKNSERTGRNNTKQDSLKEHAARMERHLRK